MFPILHLYIHSLLNKEVLLHLQQKLCQFFIQLRTDLTETYLKSEKEVLGIKWLEGQKNIQH